MPATAGRVRMPANNRVHSSAALQTHGIWQSAIGYDPYAPSKDKDAAKGPDDQAATGDAENAYASFQGLLALARITGSSSNETRGACKRCGRVGHLTFQCRNFLSVKDDKEKDGDVSASIQTANAVFEKIKKASKKDGAESGPEEDEDDESEESESSDSDVDPEIEKIIAARFGKKVKKKTTEEDSVRRGRSKKRSNRGDDDSEIEEEERRREKRKKRHMTSDDDEDDRKRRHRKSRKDRKKRSHKKNEDSDESDEESDRRRRHRCKRRNRRRDASASESDSDDEPAGDRKRSHRSERRRGRRAASDSSYESDSSDKEDSRVRKEKGRIDKKSKDHRRV
ncbi:CAX-interacting protein 4 [Dioscorea cayenensis subsp. rotundata]|uniref:CAX-interacting protein 4 n=1 Tax=Dioscorea cayennensis subsp. rotundata TaxID=55577 RepID=A0AB40AW86_DIOCR|nr:CAX-interacting protein 4 [Dioscorea cayenensis subsp. rotundata]